MTIRTLIIALALLAAVSTLAAETYTGKVIKIADGDTLTLLVDRQQIKVRLSDIDAPERKQPFGTRARQALSELAFGKLVRVVEVDRDRWGRLVRRLYVDNIDVNAELVRLGFAWVYRKYSDDGMLLFIEEVARSARRGLWVDAAPVPPWEWRKAKR